MDKIHFFIAVPHTAFFPLSSQRSQYKFTGKGEPTLLNSIKQVPSPGAFVLCYLGEVRAHVGENKATLTVASEVKPADMTTRLIA